MIKKWILTGKTKTALLSTSQRMGKEFSHELQIKRNKHQEMYNETFAVLWLQKAFVDVKFTGT